METSNAKFLENGKVNGSEEWKNIDIKEIKVNTPLPIMKKAKVNIPLPINVLLSVTVPNIALGFVECFDNNEQHLNDDTSNKETNPQMFKRN